MLINTNKYSRIWSITFCIYFVNKRFFYSKYITVKVSRYKLKRNIFSFLFKKFEINWQPPVNGSWYSTKLHTCILSPYQTTISFSRNRPWSTSRLRDHRKNKSYSLLVVERDDPPLPFPLTLHVIQYVITKSKSGTRSNVIENHKSNSGFWFESPNWCLKLNNVKAGVLVESIENSRSCRSRPTLATSLNDALDITCACARVLPHPSSDRWPRRWFEGGPVKK